MNPRAKKRAIRFSLVIAGLVAGTLLSDFFYGRWVEQKLQQDIQKRSYTEQGYIKGAAPFVYKASNNKACLLIHGYCDSPRTMRFLAKEIHQIGYDCYAIALPGHGTTPMDLQTKSWQDWYQKSLQEYQKLQKHYPQVYIVGFSTGATTAFKIAQSQQPSGIIALAPFFQVPRLIGFLPPESLLEILSTVMFQTNYLRKTRPPGISDPKAREKFIDYDYLPVNTTLSLFHYASLTRRGLSHVKTPVLILHGKKDRTAAPAASKEILAELDNAPEKNLIYYDNSEHVLLMDIEKEQVAQDVLEHLQRWSEERK